MAISSRREDWPERLADKLREWRERSFQWGTADCMQFTTDIVQAMTERDITYQPRWKYSTEFGGLKAIRERYEIEFGMPDRPLEPREYLAALVTRKLGVPVHPNFAQRGDVLMHGNNLGICSGSVGVFRAHEGLVYINLADCSKAWKVD